MKCGQIAETTVRGIRRGEFNGTKQGIPQAKTARPEEGGRAETIWPLEDGFGALIDMVARYTYGDLWRKTDYEMLKSIVKDRQDTLSNPRFPLYQKLVELYNKLDRGENLTK